MNKKNLIALIAAAAMLLSFTACNNNSTSDSSQSASDGTSQTAPAGASVLTADIPLDTVIVTVEGSEDMNITFGDFLKEYKYYLAAYDITDDTTEMYAEVLTSRREYIVNYLINEEIMQKKFDELGFTLTDEENRQIDEDTEAGAESIKETLKAKISASLAEGEELTEEELSERARQEFDRLLSDCGLSYDDFRNWQRSIVVQQKLTDHVNKDYTLDYSEAESQAERLISDIKASYEEDPSTYNTDTMSELWIPEGSRYIQHILLKLDDETVTEIAALRGEGRTEEADKLRDEKIAEMSAEITEVESKVNAGEDFQSLMNEYSDDGDTTMSYLIVPGTTQYMDGFAETALAIPELGGTDKCITDYGWHIIRYTSDASVSEDVKKAYIDGLYEYLAEANISKNFSDAMVEWRGAYSFEIDRDTLLLAEETTAEAQ